MGQIREFACWRWLMAANVRTGVVLAVPTYQSMRMDVGSRMKEV